MPLPYGGVYTPAIAMSPGIGSTGAYTLPGLPFLTGSNLTGSGTNGGEVKISFPRVTRHITITNAGSTPLLVHFDSRTNSNVADHKHYVILDQAGAAWAFNIRSKEVYISMQNAVDNGTFSLSAELTSIDVKECHTLSGSGIND